MCVYFFMCVCICIFYKQYSMYACFVSRPLHIILKLTWTLVFLCNTQNEMPNVLVDLLDQIKNIKTKKNCSSVQSLIKVHSIVTAREKFSGRYCFALRLFFFMFVCALSLERLDGSQPDFHKRWRGGRAQTRRQFNRLAAILKKHCFPALSRLIMASSSSNSI